jgi:hypothetical protein
VKTSHVALSIGIVPRGIESLFNRLKDLQANDSSYAYQVYVSFLELYNEEIIDLLNPHSRPGTKKGSASSLTIREDGQGGIYWAGVKEEQVSGPEELFR